MNFECAEWVKINNKWIMLAGNKCLKTILILILTHLLWLLIIMIFEKLLFNMFERDLILIIFLY